MSEYIPYLWVIPAILLVLSLVEIAAYRREVRLIGFSLMLWAGLAFIIWAVVVDNEYWYAGVLAMFYAMYGFWRNTYGVPKEVVEREAYEGKEFS